MRWQMITADQSRLTTMTIAHRSWHMRFGVLNEDPYKDKRSRATASWPSQGCGFKVRNVLAGSYSGETFEFIPRCWACRGMTPFFMYRAEADDERAWAGADYESDNLEWRSPMGLVVRGRNDAERQHYIQSMGSCAEIWCAVALLEISRGRERT